MSAFKKVAGLVAGISAMGAIGVAVAQGVPPNPYISNPALGAGEQTVHLTPIGETGVLAWADTAVQQTATITKENEQAVVSQPAPETQQPVAAASTTTESTQVAQAPAADNSNATRSMGAGPAEDNNTPAPVRKARHDRG